MTSDEIKLNVWNFLRSKGLPEKSVAAVMGNIYGESEFNPDLVEVGTGIGFGLCQWSYSRRTQLETYGTDLAHQEEFLWSELTGENLNVTGASYQWINQNGYLTHDEFMSASGSIEDLTAAFCFCWERPDAALAHLDTRQTMALQYYTTYTGIIPSSGKYKLKNNYLYPYANIFLSRKFTSSRKQFELIRVVGDMAVIKDGEILRNVPKKNLIKC